jgi:Cu-Zn family superoxide dismutase
MTRKTIPSAALALALAALAPGAWAASHTAGTDGDSDMGPIDAEAEFVEGVARGTIMNRDGERIGQITLNATDSGLTHVYIRAEGIEPGVHAVHIHETGECEGDFTSAGGHIAGDAQHGLVAGGAHPGDLPNAHVHDDGILEMEAFDSRLDYRAQLMDEDGSAFIIHSGADDYQSQPSGDAGGRVACAVIVPDQDS